MDARTISASELAKHKAEDDCWIAIHGKVYNVTEYLLDHPGGLDVMMDHSGAYRFLFNEQYRG
jgi:cytochrome b involved in lipid metabolism